MLPKQEHGKVITACGLIEPGELGRVMMHEHLHSDLWDWEKDELVSEEHPISPDRRQYLLDNAVPLLRRCREEFGMNAYVDATMPPWRAWPDVYRQVSERSGVHIVLSTGYYREIESGTYFVKTPADAIWPFVREASAEELTELCVGEIAEGIHGTDIRAGVIKLGTSQAPMTEAETKTFVAGAAAQKRTGVHITTHCTQFGAETSQLTILDREGVDLSRVVIGHTAWHLKDTAHRRAVIEWMKRGASFLPTNICVWDPAEWKDQWQPLIDAIHQVFDAGLGDRLFLGLDSGYCSESQPFSPATFLPPDPWCYMHTDVLPAFRAMGLTEDEERAILIDNPRRIIPVQ